MDRAGTNSECRARKGALVAVLVLFALVLNPAMPAESDDPAPRGALEVTSGLGRPLYALPDDQAVIEAGANLQADPTSADRELKLSPWRRGRNTGRQLRPPRRPWPGRPTTPTSTWNVVTESWDFASSSRP